jgi:hypothetical protein
LHCWACGCPGYERSDETKNKISNSLIGNKRSVGRRWSEDEKDRFRKKSIELWNTPGYRENIVEKTRKKTIEQWQTPGHRERVSEANFKAKEDKAITISVDGVEYRSMREVRRALGTGSTTIHRRCMDPNYPNWIKKEK